jgi:hypothetical protein
MTFCGLPVRVATLPAFDPNATASRYGMGGSSASSTIRTTRGVIMRHTVSFTRSAESPPAVNTSAHSSVRGVPTAWITAWLAHRKKPASAR